MRTSYVRHISDSTLSLTSLDSETAANILPTSWCCEKRCETDEVSRGTETHVSSVRSVGDGTLNRTSTPCYDSDHHAL